MVLAVALRAAEVRAAVTPVVAVRAVARMQVQAAAKALPVRMPAARAAARAVLARTQAARVAAKAVPVRTRVE